MQWVVKSVPIFSCTLGVLDVFTAQKCAWYSVVSCRRPLKPRCTWLTMLPPLAGPNIHAVPFDFLSPLIFFKVAFLAFAEAPFGI